MARWSWNAGHLMVYDTLVPVHMNGKEFFHNTVIWFWRHQQNVNVCVTASKNSCTLVFDATAAHKVNKNVWKMENSITPSSKPHTQAPWAAQSCYQLMPGCHCYPLTITILGLPHQRSMCLQAHSQTNIKAYAFNMVGEIYSPKRACEFFGSHRFITVLQLVEYTLQCQGHALWPIISLCWHHVHCLKNNKSIKNIMSMWTVI